MNDIQLTELIIYCLALVASVPLIYVVIMICDKVRQRFSRTTAHGVVDDRASDDRVSVTKPQPLELVSTDDLVHELQRRHESVVVAYTDRRGKYMIRINGGYLHLLGLSAEAQNFVLCSKPELEAK